MRAIIYTVALAALATVSSAFPTGAGTCLSQQAIIEAVPKQPMGKLNPNLGFALDVGLTGGVYEPKGKSIQIKLTGKTPFAGALIYAVDQAKNHVGSWDVPTGFQIKAGCLGDPKGTLTHTSPAKKGPAFTFTWTPPASDVGVISFASTFVVNAATGFQIVKSANFTAAGGNITAPSTTTSAAVPTPPAAPTNTNTGTGTGTDPYGSPAVNSSTSSPTTGGAPTVSAPTSTNGASTSTNGASSMAGSSSLILQLVTATAFVKLLLAYL